MSRSNRKIYSSSFLDMVILFIGYSLLYFFNIGAYPLFTPDEGRYSEVAREMIETGDYVTPHNNGTIFLDKPVLFYWLQVIAIRVFGLHELALRFFPILFAITLCLFTYKVTLTLYDRRTARFASMILATTPIFFCSAHYANLDMEICFWISSILFLFLMSINNKLELNQIDQATNLQVNASNYYITLMFICAGLGFLTKGLIAIVLPFGIIFIWSVLFQYKLFFSLFTWKRIVIFLSLVLPWFILTQIKNKDFLYHYFIMQHFERYLSAEVFNNTLPWWFYIPVFLIGTFPWSIFFPQTIRTFLRSRAPAEFFLFIWLVLVITFFSIPHSKIITYILPSIPPFAILIARYLSLHWHSKPNFSILKISFFSIICLNLLLCLFGPRAGLDLLPTVNIFNLSLLCSSIILFKYHRILKLKFLFFHWLVVSALSLLLLTNSANLINSNNSTKQLNITLKKLTKNSQPIIFTYYNYYYDAPIYLNQKVHIINNWRNKHILEKDNWAREFYLGNRYQASSLLLEENSLAKIWHSNQTLYVYLDQKHLSQFKMNIGKYYRIAQSNDTLVISNHPLSFI